MLFQKAIIQTLKKDTVQKSVEQNVQNGMVRTRLIT